MQEQNADTVKGPQMKHQHDDVRQGGRAVTHLLPSSALVDLRLPSVSTGFPRVPSPLAEGPGYFSCVSVLH